MMGPRARIDLAALRHNLLRVRKAAPRSRIMAVIKSNAYGHGVLRAARALDQADAFGLARVCEGVALRDAGIPKPIVILEGFFDREELEAASEYGLELGISRPEQLDLLESGALRRPVRCWLKVNTGMNRLGFRPEAMESAWERLQGAESVSKPVRLMSHFANADDPRDGMTDRQLRLFTGLAATTGAELSIANSGGILAWPDAHLDWVRPGIML